MKQLKQKKCKNCLTLFSPRTSLQKVCSPSCAYEFVKSENKRLDAKKTRKAYKDTKEKLKSLTEWLNECKTLAQKYSRLRDFKDGCISCNKTANWGGQWHGSHFRPAGNYKAVSLNLWNIHKACSECNGHKSGNLIEYQDRLIEKIGQDKVDWLKTQNQPHRFTIEYLKRYKKVMAKMCRRLEKRIK